MRPATDDNASTIVTNGSSSTIAPGGESISFGDTIAPVCAEVNKRVTAFLEVDAEGELLKRVQGRTREALRVIGECLERYRYAFQLVWKEGRGIV